MRSGIVDPVRRRQSSLGVLFIVALPLNGIVTFIAQPVVAKALLPAFGGSAMVWTTVALCFQACLLLGYVYAHLLTRVVDRRFQVWVHALVLSTAAMLAFQWPALLEGRPEGNETIALLLLVGRTIGPLCAALFATAPIILSWHGDSNGGGSEGRGHRKLYAVSTLGNILGLVAYPALIERSSDLTQQLGVLPWWGLGLALLCLIPSLSATTRASVHRTHLTASVATSELVTWVSLPAVGTSLLLGVTAHLSYNVAAVPLLWVAPLAGFLIAHALAFGLTTIRQSVSWHLVVGRSATVAAVLLLFLASSGYPLRSLGAHLLLSTVVQLALAVRLACSAPTQERITAFYLCLAVGGTLGGIANSVIAPLIFNGFLEYPIALVVAHMCLSVRGPSVSRRDGLEAVALVGCGLALVLIGEEILRALGSQTRLATTAVRLALPLSLAFMARPHWLLRGGILGLIVATLIVAGKNPVEVWRTRTFYGTLQVIESGGTRALVNGRILHGSQGVASNDRLRETYYGPVRDVVGSYSSPPDGAVIGLGTGTVSAYAAPGSEWTFFEIDAAVIELATRPDGFNYLSEAADSGVTINVRNIDGRKGVSELADGAVDLIVVDAFSGDSIPVHLVTMEAFRLYLRKLRDGGMLLVHISNKYLDLGPAIVAVGTGLGLGAAQFSGEFPGRGSEASDWLLFRADAASLNLGNSSGLASQAGQLGSAWVPAVGNWGGHVWTDRYSAVLETLR